MTRLVIGLSVVALASAASGQDPPRSISFIDSYRTAPPAGITLVPGEGTEPSEQLVIEKTVDGEQTFEIAYLDDPGITASAYAVVGEVRYEDVDQPGYLMTWNCFVDGKYFSKAITDFGPSRKIFGDSGWRKFELAFYCTPDPQERSPRPYRVELCLVMPGKGKVSLRNLQLKEHSSGSDWPPRGARPDAEDAPVGARTSEPGQWWSGPTAGWIGGIGGTVICCLGGLIGTLAGLGRARRLAIGLMSLMAVIGVSALIAGVVALFSKQPYAVYYPLLLAGLLCTILPIALFKTIIRRYEEIELRKMNALDAH